jgi:hypothetical protein
MTNFQIDDLTPVEEHGGVFFKREDLFAPFDDLPVTGGKVRQCLALVTRRLAHIKDECDSTIATAASVHSPQSAIVARIAKEFGLKCIIGHGAKQPLKHRPLSICTEFGAELVQLTTAHSFTGVLYGRLRELNKKRKFFTIAFGYNAATDPTAIIETVARQVANLPTDMRELVINVGSGVSANAILEGVSRYWQGDIGWLRIHLIQPFGYDRKIYHPWCMDVHRWLGDYDYARRLQLKVGEVDLDQIYESKAFDFWRKQIPSRDPTVFWIIGNSNGLR